ncbi:tRNA dimethylallyltransferase [Spirochaetota bacterium]|nr:tRNA dimethylallyltransferase [Spirochaetota bacterium]
MRKTTIASNIKPISNIIAITGPTACGKTALVQKIARKEDIIINADSRQLYKHLNIGVAKPSTPEQIAYPYRLIDHQPLHKPFTAYDFLEHVKTTVLEQQHNPHSSRIFIVGGTLFYFSALENGLIDLKVDDSLSEQLNREYMSYGLPKLRAELKERDLDHFNQIDKNNPRRIIRALALLRTHQQPLKTLQRKRLPFPYRLHKIILIPPKQTLWKTIETRAENMFINDRLIHEVKQILKQGISKSVLLKHKTIGYLEITEYLNGFYSRETALAKIIKRTKLLAKHQITWLKKQQHAHFIFLGAPTDFITPHHTANTPHHTSTGHPPTTCHFSSTKQKSPRHATNKKSQQKRSATSTSLIENWSLTPDNIVMNNNKVYFAKTSDQCRAIAVKLCEECSHYPHSQV